MKTQEWERINNIVVDALDLDPMHRSAFIEERCSDSPALRREVESLLAAAPATGGFLEAPAIKNYASLIERPDATEAVLGQSIGNYRTIKEIGSGGMGAVYLAERIDGKFEQRVALKLLKREMNTAALRRHFEQERSILAALQHPNIARLLDAGTTSDGIPFLVMEFVEGMPIDEFCAMNDLSLNQRLDLFREVCSAVHFAHRNLIIHRDLKPSNILVTSDGIPKLLDFGISKILSRELDKDDAKTITRMGVMTPSYASPEQLKNESVTTATDVYSLGVILFELLAGRRPFEGHEAHLSDILRHVIQDEPPLPSSVAVESGSPEHIGRHRRQRNTTGAARARQTLPQMRAVKVQQLRGDLDNIILKALKKEPDRRYSSVERLVDDIERHRRGLPVSARPDTFVYRTQKFVSRNKSGVVAGSLVFLALVGGLVATLWQARVARAESERARHAQARAEKVNAYLQNVLNFSNPHWLSSNPKRNREATVAQAMDEALKTIDVELAGEPEIQGEILFTLTQSYTSQGDFKKGEDLAQRAIARFDEALGSGNPRSKQVGVILADLYYLTGRFDEAEVLYLSTIDDFRPKVGNDPSYLKWLAIALNDLSNIRMMKGDFKDADNLVNESVGLARQITGRDRYCLPVVLGNQASVRQALNDHRGAIETAMNALAESSSMGSGESFEAGNLYMVAGKSSTMLDDFSGAEKYHAKADAIFVNTVGIANVYTLVNRYHIAHNLFRSGRVSEARKSVEETIAEQQRSLPEDHFTLSYSQRLLGEIMTASGQLKEGEKEIRMALDRLLRKLKEPNHEIGFVKIALAENLIEQNRKDEARVLLDSALDSVLKTRGDNNYYTDRCRRLLKRLE